ncbi:helix-turn-helix transcriptional regulator [Desulfoluna butyratoxydans]|uniref:Yheo-like n=1 Tax=Desulfoluna butyratoxydans TaxID=231438 RepID=A0A4U8YIA9_9BACT|nr:PAS domain-containing protein [Desulfoluna butyratoxydans]VFQ43047.1 yheo-like [Desulfoluna butyratoxydans]
MNDALKRQYSLIVEFLGKALGPDFEVVLHDTEDHINSIVAIANGHISQRTVGAPLTDFGLEVISNESFSDKKYKINYNGVSKDHRILRSSTMFIRDDNKNIVGLLCINFDDRRYKNISEQILKLCHPDMLIESNNAYESVDSLVNNAGERFYDSAIEETDAVIQGYLNKHNTSIDRLVQDDRIDIVDILNQKGIFKLKGAVRTVAKQLGCSEPTIYRYLSKL